MQLRSLCGVILLSRRPARLADFYSRVLGCKFEREIHGDVDEHFGVDIGTVHFGIHPPSNFRRTTSGQASTAVAFNVTSLMETMAILDELGAEQVHEPHNEGFGLVASYLDPEGNLFEIVELVYEFEADDS